jgi:hypothetical protein
MDFLSRTRSREFDVKVGTKALQFCDDRLILASSLVSVAGASDGWCSSCKSCGWGPVSQEVEPLPKSLRPFVTFQANGSLFFVHVSLHPVRRSSREVLGPS